jgi:hypothetical protein
VICWCRRGGNDTRAPPSRPPAADRATRGTGSGSSGGAPPPGMHRIRPEARIHRGNRSGLSYSCRSRDRDRRGVGRPSYYLTPSACGNLRGSRYHRIQFRKDLITFLTPAPAVTAASMSGAGNPCSRLSCPATKEMTSGCSARLAADTLQSASLDPPPRRARGGTGQLRGSSSRPSSSRDSSSRDSSS